MIEFIKNLPSSPYFTLLFYWLPVFICIIGTIIRTVCQYRSDLARRAEAMTADPRSSRSIYTPTLKVGTIIGRVLGSVIPVVNVCYAVFSLIPEAMGGLFKWLDRTFDFDLVPRIDHPSTKSSSDEDP